MEQIEFISQSLEKIGILQNYSSEIQEMINNDIILPDMTLQTAYTTFLLKKSNENPVFSSILKRECLFDISFLVDSKNTSAETLRKNVTDTFGKKLSYVYVETRNEIIFCGIKLSGDTYKSSHKISAEDYTQPYDLLAKILPSPETVTFSAGLFPFQQNKGVRNAFNSLMEHLKTLELPISIAHADILYLATNPLAIYQAYVYLEPSAQWPKDHDAMSCAKTAFYCQLYKQSKHAVYIDKENITFQYKEFYFNIKIILEQEKDARYHLETALQPIVKERGSRFHGKILQIKTVLADIGVYPLYLDDLLIDSLALTLPESIIGYEKFLKEFFAQEIAQLAGHTLDLVSKKISKRNINRREVLMLVLGDVIYNYELPASSILMKVTKQVSDIIHWDRPIFDGSKRVKYIELEPFLSEYDFILSIEPIEGAEEIIGALCTEFELGTPIYKEFLQQELMKQADIFYSPTAQILVARVNPGISKDLLANLLITRSSFRYIKRSY